jgi:hypothetical protein
MPFASQITVHVRWPPTDDDSTFPLRAAALRGATDADPDAILGERPHMTRDGQTAGTIEIRGVGPGQVSSKLKALRDRIALVDGAIITEIRYNWVHKEEGEEIV